MRVVHILRRRYMKVENRVPGKTTSGQASDEED